MAEIFDLRSYIDTLSHEGKLTTINKPVSLIHELANVSATLARQGGQGVLFNQLDVSNEVYPWRIFANAVVDSSTAALALDCQVPEIIDRMSFALEPANAISPELTEEQPAWMDNVLTGEEIDLNKIPIPTHGLHDGGPFITGGVVVTKDPVSGRGNLSYNRMQVLGKHTFGFNVNEWRHVMQFYKVQQAKGEGLQVAVVIGIDPAISIAGGARYDDDELCIAGCNSQ